MQALKSTTSASRRAHKRQSPTDHSQGPPRKKWKNVASSSSSPIKNPSEGSPEQARRQLLSPVPSGQNRKAGAFADQPPKRAKNISNASNCGSRLDSWLLGLPPPGESYNMEEPALKRSRSSSTSSRARSPSSGQESLWGDKRSSIYADANFQARLQNEGSFLEDSAGGPLTDEVEMCKEFLKSAVETPSNTMFDDDDVFRPFCERLNDCSEARVFLDLHRLLIPPVEHLYLRGNRAFASLVEGYNDRWIKTDPLSVFLPLPQPDCTIGFRSSAFSEEELRKLGIRVTGISNFTARSDLYFPFFTCEIKSAGVSLKIADRQNANSMTVALRGLVGLYQKSGRERELHRKILGFSMSHDNACVRLYGHYPEIQGEKTSYYRHLIRKLDITDKNGEERWLPYHFSHNILERFSAKLLTLIKRGIEHIHDPNVEPSHDRASIPQDPSFPQDPSQASSQERLSLRTGRSSGGNTQQRAMLQRLESLNEQQRQESKEQMELQRQESKERETRLVKELEQRRQESQEQMELQRQESKERETRLVKELGQLREILGSLLAKTKA